MKTITVALGSSSRIKARATRKAFKIAFPKAQVKLFRAKVDSGVSAQPVGLEEMEKGAATRARRVLDLYPRADFSVGIELCHW